MPLLPRHASPSPTMPFRPWPVLPHQTKACRCTPCPAC